jgi:lysozyme
MGRLLWLFLLSPVMLFGQVRQKALADSIKAAATDVKHISSSISNNPYAKLEGVNITDSDGYVTVVMRVHVREEVLISRLTHRPAASLRMAPEPGTTPDLALLPHLPPVIVPDTINLLPRLAVKKLHIEPVLPGSMATASLPALPIVPYPPEALQFIAVARLQLPAIVPHREDSAMLPPLPIVPYPPEAMDIIAVSNIHIRDIPPGHLDTMVVPPLPDVDMLFIDPIEIAANRDVFIPRPTRGSMDTTTVPPFLETRLEAKGMHLSDQGYSLLEKLEGFSPALYSLKDGGFTIGFGFFVPYDEVNKWNKTLTIEDAERIMRQKVPNYENQVKRYINVPLTQEEFDALTMLAYNLGGFSKATSIVNDVNGGADFEQLQADWMRFIHSKAPGVTRGLMNRRHDEIQVRNESNYQHDRKIQIIKTRT